VSEATRPTQCASSVRTALALLTLSLAPLTSAAYGGLYGQIIRTADSAQLQLHYRYEWEVGNPELYGQKRLDKGETQMEVEYALHFSVHDYTSTLHDEQIASLTTTGDFDIMVEIATLANSKLAHLGVRVVDIDFNP